jgi:hypothetical protein
MLKLDLKLVTINTLLLYCVIISPTKVWKQRISGIKLLSIVVIVGSVAAVKSSSAT